MTLWIENYFPIYLTFIGRTDYSFDEFTESNHGERGRDEKDEGS